MSPRKDRRRRGSRGRAAALVSLCLAVLPCAGCASWFMSDADRQHREYLRYVRDSQRELRQRQDEAQKERAQIPEVETPPMETFIDYGP